MEKYTVHLIEPQLHLAKVVIVEATHYSNAKTKALDMYPGYVLFDQYLWTNQGVSC